MSTIKVNSLVPANPGSEDYFLPRAWLRYNQQNNTIGETGNVSSISDNGTGDMTVNFATTLPSSTYAMTGTATGYTNGNQTNPESNIAVVAYYYTSTGGFGGRTSSSARLCKSDNNQDVRLDCYSTDVVFMS